MLHPTLDTVRLFVHVLAASVWVGGQLVVGAIVPRVRAVSPDATRAVARGFATVAWPAFAIAVVTGAWNLSEISVTDTSTAYQITLFVKVALVVVSGVAAGAHSWSPSRLVIALGGALALVGGLGAFFSGYLLTTGT